MYNTKSKIAIVYDWIDKWGGVERILLHLSSLFPQAHFFTSAVDLKNAKWAKHLTIHSSFLQSFPLVLRTNRALITTFYPLAFESFKFDEYDVVISITSAFAKGIITKPNTKHICYLLTPPRYLWSNPDDYLSGIKGFFGKPALDHLRKWDLIAAMHPDEYISISRTTAERAKQYYKINSSVIYPPFDTLYWDQRIKEMKKPKNISCKNAYYLWVGRMESYKKVELVLEVARQKSKDVFIFVGIGTLENQLKKTAPQNCLFTGLISDSELSYLYSHAKALIMPQNEDFGYVSLEAQYHGCPVIAYKKGGAIETITEGVSGLFFDNQTVPSLVSRLERYEQISYNLIHSTGQLQESIKERFGIERFNAQFVYQLNQLISL